MNNNYRLDRLEYANVGAAPTTTPLWSSRARRAKRQYPMQPSFPPSHRDLSTRDSDVPQGIMLRVQETPG
jgi:hypothetical protein